MKNPFALPSALQIAVRSLEAAQRDQLAATAQAEYYFALQIMLQNRVARLKLDILNLTQENEHEIQR